MSNLQAHCSSNLCALAGNIKGTDLFGFDVLPILTHALTSTLP
jgi:hypothetical protein